MKNSKSYNPQKTYLIKKGNENSDYKACILKFSMCDDKYPLYNLNKNELKEFISFAKKVEKLTWNEIKSYSGLKYEVLNNMKMPSNISKDITIRSMRISGKFRIIGYRDDEYFYIIWFDNNHNTC